MIVIYKCALYYIIRSRVSDINASTRAYTILILFYNNIYVIILLLSGRTIRRESHESGGGGGGTRRIEHATKRTYVRACV